MVYGFGFRVSGLCLGFIISPTLCTFLFCLTNQVLEEVVDRRRIGYAALSDTTIGSERVELADGTTDDFVSIPLPNAISDLCRKSPNFLQALRDMAEKISPRLHAYACTRTLN